LERVGEGFAIAEGEERMDVIGHDDVAPEAVALAVEVMEAVGDDWGEAWITQGVGAVRSVEVFVELVGERDVVACFGDVVPRRRIRSEEGLAGLVSEASAKDEREASRRGVHAAANRRGGRCEACGLSILCTLTPFPPFPPFSRRFSEGCARSQSSRSSRGSESARRKVAKV